PLRFDYIQGTLETLVIHLSAQAAVRVTEGDEGGWSLLRASVRYDYYRTRIELTRFTRQDDGKRSGSAFEGRDWALLLSKALGLGGTGVAAWWGRQALRPPRAFGFHGPLPLQPFMALLYALWKKVRLDERRFAQAKLGPYRDVIAAWHDEGRLAA